MAKRAILYARTSKVNENTSLGNQIEKCKEYALENGFEIVQEIREQKSGASGNRNGLDIAKELGRKGLADCIIVTRFDRFMRGDDAEADPGTDSALVERELRLCGLETIYLELPDNDNSPSAVMFKAMKRMIASLERQTIRDRMEGGRMARLREGKPAQGGLPPLGYRYDQKGYYEIVESEAEAVRLIFKMFLQDINIPSIVKYLRENNIPGYRGSIGKWNDPMVKGVLKKPCYYGRHAAITHKTVKSTNHKAGFIRVLLPEDEWIFIDVPPIISKETWDRAQARFRIKKRTQTNNTYLLSGRISCECGYAMVGNQTKRTNKNGSEKVYTYYICKGNVNACALHPCNDLMVRADLVESAVYSWCQQVVTEKGFIEKLYKRAQEKKAESEIPLRNRLDSVIIELTEAESRLRKIASLMIDASEIELSVYKPETENLRRKIEYLRSIKKEVETDLQKLEENNTSFYSLVQFIDASRTVFYSKYYDPDFRAKVIRALNVKVVVSHDRKKAFVECTVGSEILDLYREDEDNSELINGLLELAESQDVMTEDTTLTLRTGGT